MKIQLKDEDLRILQRYKLNCRWCWTASQKEAPKIHPAVGEVLGPVYKTEVDYFKGNNTDL